MKAAAPWQMSAAALASAYAAGTLSPVEALENIAQREREVQPLVNALVCWDEDGARAAARASERRWRSGKALSALDGVPLTVKDNIPVRGLPCRWGSRLFADHVSEADEVPVARLRTAGAVILGKTNVPEFTLLGCTDNLLAGPTRNPWDLALTPGGSSGGAVAAVASGIGPLALATDGGGSIRRPCGHTALAGLKPTWGRVPRGGGLPEMLPELEVIGPIARTVDDLVRLLAVIGPGPHSQQRAVPPLRRIVCWRAIGASPVDPAILASLDAAVRVLRDLGCAVAESEAPPLLDQFNRDGWPVLSTAGLAAVLAPIARAQGEEAVQAQLTPAMAALWRNGRQLRGSELLDAQQLVRRVRTLMDETLLQHDVVLTPSAAAMPWLATETHPASIAGTPVGPRGHAVFTAFVNACGLPALAVPGQPDAAGLPIGLQLVGRRGSDDALCALGRAWEAAQPWAARWPLLSIASASTSGPAAGALQGVSA